jgi:hypothetical protein
MAWCFGQSGVGIFLVGQFSSAASSEERHEISISAVLHQAQDRAKVKRFGLRGVRHFFASALHQAGASLAQAKEA